MESPIALVGAACRFPKDIFTPDDLWQMLQEERDAVDVIPSARGWDISGLYNPEPGTPGKFYIKKGCVLRDPYAFDASFFGISPKEARGTDPQQGLVLELSWEAFERARIAPLSLQGTRTGVFIGCCPATYYTLSQDAEKAAAFSNYWGTGTAASVISGRISYKLGLEGPAITVDTGCSSALTALHLACQSLRLGECDLALAGGVTVMTTPDSIIFFSSQRALAPDGICKPFAANADGTSFAEGGGMLVVERLSDAQRLRHPVLAIIKGTALNQDGSTSSGLAAPSTYAQIQVIRSALRNADLAPMDVDVVEAHGTGTTLGDPIEAHALIEAYGRGRQNSDPLWVGSLKANIGHTQGAAGVAGIIKMMQAMRHGELPKTLHVNYPTPHVPWDKSPLKLITDPIAWPERGHPRRAGISAFGISGTNAHVIIEEAPLRRGSRPTNLPTRPEHRTNRASSKIPFLLSAKSPQALRGQARQLAEYLTQPTSADASMADIGFSLATTRSPFKYRSMILASDRNDLHSRLMSLAGGKPSKGVVVGRSGRTGRISFIFPGQGGQWPGMAARLLAESSVFAKKIAECNEALNPYVDWSLLQLLREGPNQQAISHVDIIQPMLFAIGVALAELWRSMGVEPEAVVGHSLGEVAAAYVCGAISLDTGARIAALRSKALSQLAGRGAMASLPLSAEDTRRLIADHDVTIEVAVMNGPTSTVISGDKEVIKGFIKEITAAGIKAKEIQVDFASHSVQVEQVRGPIIHALSGVSANSGNIPFYSTVTGGPINTASLDATYWWESLRNPVRFSDAVQAMASNGFGTFIEVNPHPVLGPAIQETVDGILPASQSATIVGSLRRDQNGLDHFLSEVGRSYVAGVPVNWSSCFNHRSSVHVDLPTYAFQREQHKLNYPPSGIKSTSKSRQNIQNSGFDEMGDLFLLDWVTAPDFRSDILPDHVAIVGLSAWSLIPAMRESGIDVQEFLTTEELLTSVNRGRPVPRLAFTSCPAPDFSSTIRDSHVNAAWALETIRKWLTEPKLNDVKLIFITRQAIACTPSDPVTGVAESTIWGLVRSAQSEHPGRFVIIDTETSDTLSVPNVISAALTSDESQLGIRKDITYVPRFIPARQNNSDLNSVIPKGVGQRDHASGTVLITGGTGSLGSQIARHLAAEHGARHLLLASRRGAGSPGAQRLASDIRGLGAEVRFASCDARDLDEVRALVDTIPVEHPLTGVIHSAGTLDNCIISDMTRDRLDAVLSPKVDAAWNVYQATRRFHLTYFILFSSVAGIHGFPGQGNYAAANSFLDSFAFYLRGQGVPASALAWGTWAAKSGLIDLTAVDYARLQRNEGMLPMDPKHALTLFSMAVENSYTYTALNRLDPESLHVQKVHRTLNPLLGALAAGNPAASGIRPNIAAITAGSNPGEESTNLDMDGILEFIRTQAATILGYPDAQSIDKECPFRDLGFDSVSSLELMQRLALKMEVRMPTRLMEERITPADLASILHQKINHEAELRFEFNEFL